VEPVKFVQHEARPEAHGTPGLELAIDRFDVALERFARLEKRSIMAQVMDPDLESVFAQPLQQIRGHLVFTLRDEIEGRANAVLHFDLGQLPAAVQAFQSSTSCVIKKANCFPSGQPGQPSGGFPLGSKTGHELAHFFRIDFARSRRMANRTCAGRNGLSM